MAGAHYLRFRFLAFCTPRDRAIADSMQRQFGGTGLPATLVGLAPLFYPSRRPMAEWWWRGAAERHGEDGRRRASRPAVLLEKPR